MIRNTGNYSGASNRNFAQMLEEINFNLQSFPLTSLSNNNNSNNAGGSQSQQSNNNAQSNGIVGHSSSNAILSSHLHGDSSSSNQQIGGGFHLRYQMPPNNNTHQYESSGNNYLRNRDNNSQHGANENSQSNNRKKQNSSPKIQDILTCFICLGKLRNAHMCPDCQKMCCEGCIKEWLSNKSQCPHCRSHLRPSKLMKCRFVSEITTALEKIEQIEQKKEKQGVCQEHENPLQYYCQICKHPVCSDCGMIGPKHKNHKFEKLNNVYDAHVKQVNQELSAVKKKLKELTQQQQEVDVVIDKITKLRDDKSSSLRQQMEYVNIKLNDLLKTKLEKLSYQRGPITEEIDLLENMSEEINLHIETLPKSMLINKSSEIIKTLEEINNRRVIKNYISENDKKLEFQYDIIPPYDSADYFLENYSVKRRSADVAYSETLFAHGNEWRLKVYLNGKDKAKDSYLSVFIEMTKGSVKPSNFEYRVEMINQINPDLRVTREFISPFETGATWGYERFFKLDQLESEGYLLPESDMLILKYYVRSPSYSQFCHYKQNRIEELEVKNSQLLEEIRTIKDNQQQNQAKLSESTNMQVSQQIKYEGINESKAENFELETFIQEMDDANISNMRSELENYLKQKNIEEYIKSDLEDQEYGNENNHQEEQEDDEDDNDNDEEEVDREDDEDDRYEQDEDDHAGSSSSSSSGERDDQSHSEYIPQSKDQRDHQDEDFLYDNEEDMYQYKRSGNNQNQEKQIMDKIIKRDNLDDELENDQNEPIEYDSFIDEMAKRKLSRKSEIELRDQQYLREELELNGLAKDIQDILKQETDKTTDRLKAQLKEDKKNKNEDLYEFEDLYCKQDEEDHLNDLSSQHDSKQQYLDNTLKQNYSLTDHQIPFKYRDQEISAILQGNKLTDRTTTASVNEEKLRSQQQQLSQSVQQPKESDYRLRWNGIMNNVNQVLKGGEQTGNQQQLNPYSLKVNSIQEQNFEQEIEFQQEENKAEDNDLKQTIITQESDFPDIYMYLDDIGDKVQFVPLSQQENAHLSDSSIQVKKNLLPEFEQEALRLEEKKLEYQQQQLQQQQQKMKNIIGNGSSSTSTPTASSNINGIQRIERLNTDNLVSTKSKYSQNCEEQSFQSTKTNSQQPSFTQYQLQQEQARQIQSNNYFKESNGSNKFDAFLSKYSNLQKPEINQKHDQFNTKTNDANGLKSDRLYTYQINTNRVDGKDTLSFETQQFKYKKNEGESALISSVSELKGQNNTLTNSISVQNLQVSQQNGQKNTKEDCNLLGAFTNPTLSKMVATHSQQKESQEEANKTQQSQKKNSATPVATIQQNNTNNFTTSSTVAASKKPTSNVDKSEVITNELDIGDDEDILEKENKDDSLLDMEKQIQKLEMMNKLEEDQRLIQQRILQQKDASLLQQQSSNVPSQQNVAEARKQLISSINFPEDFLKKINKVKQYSTSTSVKVEASYKNQQQQHEQSSSNSLIADPALNMQCDKSQKKNSLLKSSTSELGIQLKNIQPTPISSLNTQQEKKTTTFTTTTTQVNSESQSNQIVSKQNQSPEISDSSDIKKQEEEIQKLESQVVDKN